MTGLNGVKIAGMRVRSGETTDKMPVKTDKTAGRTVGTIARIAAMTGKIDEAGDGDLVQPEGGPHHPPLAARQLPPISAVGPFLA